MARHGGFGNNAGGGTGGTPHVSAATATAILLLFVAAIWTFARNPSSAAKLLMLAVVGTVLMLMFHIDNVLDSAWTCWGVLIGGWWLSDHLRKEQAARKARASQQKGVRK